jgi:GTP-binding protein YchF
MGLKCGIIGLTNSGKTTLFNCMSNTRAVVTGFAFSSAKSNIGTCEVPDRRLEEIDKIVKADRRVYATVEIVDIPGLAKGASTGEGIGNAFLGDVRQCDALIHVLRCFDDPNLAHIDGSIHPVRDIETLDLELQIKDLEQIERKIQKVEKAARVGDKDARRQLEILNRYREHLENFQNVRTMQQSENEVQVVSDLMLLTAKPTLYVCNVDEKSVLTGNGYSDAVKEFLKDKNEQVLVIDGKLESEIAELEQADRQLFLEDVGLTEPVVNKLLRTAYQTLQLISFFTVGGKENRAWTITQGMTAVQAAGVIHSDLERGFIRAEVIKYADLLQLGSEAKVKESGKLSVEGKHYLVADGDILHIRFNV